MPDYRQYNKRERQYRAIRRSFLRTTTFIVMVVAILGISYVITSVIQAPEKKAQAQSLAQAEALKNEEEARLNAEKNGPLYGPSILNEQSELFTVTAQSITLSQNGRVEMSYFEDALFIGDSLTMGFEEYASGIKQAKYAAYIGVGPKQIIEGTVKTRTGEQVVVLEQIANSDAKKIYLLVGTNSLNSNLTDEAFLKYYADMLDKIKETLGVNVKYYIQGIPPVAAEKAQSDERFASSRIQGLNNSIARLAFERDMYFLDLFTALSDDTGALKAELAAGDNLHLNGAGYGAWKEYLITHTKHSADNPYIMGSPYIKQ